MHQLLLCLFLTGIETDIDRKHNIMLGKYLHYVVSQNSARCTPDKNGYLTCISDSSNIFFASFFWCFFHILKLHSLFIE